MALQLKMCKLNLFVMYLLFSSIPSLESARILCIFDVPFLSHQIVFRTLTNELATRGHEMTIFTTHLQFPKSESPENYTEIDIHNMTCDMMEYIKRDEKISKTVFNDLVTMFNNLDGCFLKQLQYVKDSLQLYSKDSFDLVIMEAGLRVFLIASHIFKTPIIKFSPIGAYLHNYQDMGAPTHPFLYPYMNQQRIYNLSQWEKANVLFEYLVKELITMPEIDEIENRRVRKVFGQDVPTLNELAENIDILFLNIHQVWGGNVPVPPNVIHIWGIHLRAANDLPADLEDLLELSKNGVIFMSFGSIMEMRDLPNNTRQAVMGALARMPYDIFLKWENDELPEHPKNVHIRKWWPQVDLLQHPKIKMLISHGGLLSIYEAIFGGVPIVSIPVFGDHFYNAEKCVHHKIGLKIDLESITEESFYMAIKSVADDDSYRRNIMKLRSVMLDQPESPLERAVWWTEYVLRHGGAKHLRSPAANITWAQYYQIELVLIILCCTTIIFVVVFFVLRYSYKRLGIFLRKRVNAKCTRARSTYKVKKN